MEPESGAIEHPCADHSGRTALVPRVYVCDVRVWVCLCVLRMYVSLVVETFVCIRVPVSSGCVVVWVCVGRSAIRLL